MMWPSSQASKILSLLLFGVVVYCMVMDTFLYLRIENYKLYNFSESQNATSTESSTHKINVEPLYEDVTWVPCSINPLCYPTVKALMVDHVNHYIYGPLCAALDIGIGISQNMVFLTPNMISYFHVFIALITAKLMACQSFAARRIGVVLFHIRTFLDDLDGHVARERKHIKGERSEVGTLGYLVDGICDIIGVSLMFLGILIFLKNNPPRRSYKDTTSSTLPYHQLKEISATEDIEKDNIQEVGISYKTKVSFQRIFQVMGLFGGQLFLSSIFWNRYIDIYQELLENCANFDIVRRREMFRSSIFFTATGLWRLINPHCYLHLLCLAVFCDKTWLFLRAAHFNGYLFLVFAVICSELFITTLNTFVTNGADSGL